MSERSVADSLLQESHRFEFFQAVRLLEHIARERVTKNPKAPCAPVGRDAKPKDEAVRFRAVPSLNFPSSEIVDLEETAPTQSKGQAAGPPEMRVAFMGLTGPSAVLPEHYTELLIRRIRLRDFALRDFLDLFHHRTISLFYRAWEKYRFPVAWERARLSRDREDWFTWCLRCLIGLGTEHVAKRMALSDDVLIYYAGHFARRPRSALALRSILSDYVGLPVSIMEFQGRWLRIDQAEQTRLPGQPCPDGQYHQLGVNAVLGERVWDVGTKFRLRIGPVTYSQFISLMPGGDVFASACQITRVFVGLELSFDIQIILRPEEMPEFGLSDTNEYSPRLGWNTWLGNSISASHPDDAIFESQV